MPPEIKPPTTEEIEQALKNGGVLNPEIGDALKEFEVQSQDFENTKIPTKATAEGSFMVRMVIRLSGGLVTNEKNAEYVLLGLIIIMVGVSIYFFSAGPSGELNKESLNKMLEVHPELINR
jgi:hypothetical protein